MILPRAFYFRDTKTVARELLGKRIVHQIGKTKISGRIVETEAYLGLNDPACHSYHGKKTERVKPLYLKGGHSYIYLIYGLHYCFNIVTGPETLPEAVLIRAIEPDAGTRLKTNGPGKLCAAYKIDKRQNGIDLTLGKRIWIEDAPAVTQIGVSKRIGIDSYGPCSNWPLRFFDKQSLFISGPRRKQSKNRKPLRRLQS